MSSGTNKRLVVTAPQVEAMVRPWLGAGVRCQGVEVLRGGECYQVVRVRMDRAPFEAVIKIDGEERPAGEEPFGGEAGHLRMVRGLGRFLAPEVLWEDARREAAPWACLVLQALPGRCWLEVELEGRERERVERELAELLAELHGHDGVRFERLDGREAAERWGTIMGARLRELRRDLEGRLDRGLMRSIAAALDGTEEALAAQGSPTLVHGDVWAGNILVDRHGDGWHLSGLVDWPALQYADVEYELAYLELWGTVNRTFFETYAQRRPRRAGYETRKLYYWLHTLMLHVWLGIGEGMERRVAEVAKKIIQG